MIKGVILNRVANRRHEKKLRDSIEHYCGIPVLGAIPKLDQQHFPERHLGLVPTPEHDWATDSIEAIATIAEQHLDLNAILKIAQQAPVLKTKDRELKAEGGSRKAETRDLRPESGMRNAEVGMRKAPSGTKMPAPRREVGRQKLAASNQEPAARNQRPGTSDRQPVPRIGIIQDSAFQFYYPENIDALSDGGAEVVFISPLKDRELPELDALYIGGGFPETHAQQLADNKSFSRQLKALADDGFPIYAECGGLMYLGEKLVLEGKSYPMVGVFPRGI